MLVKCETKSNRVKGLSFHPKLNWILASLHNGVIQLWDFRIGSLIERYEEHEGPVRGIDFHSSQPIFVSGGDDYKIKIWNYRQKRCIFTLLGHLDYIRTVQFHPEYPWVLSASDDQTVRIWNWQSRSCIAVLAGHNHYIMCAQFHPKQDLLISASLDQTIRVWDVSGLREKTVSIRGATGGGLTAAFDANHGLMGTGGHILAQGTGSMVLHPQQNDMFGASDAICKFILEGHERGVNWATFHSTIPLIASGADDRFVKLWRYNESKWWEVETFRGHFNNVSSVLFHPTRDLLLSNSEDRTIRVWDITKRILVHTFRRENDRFWILASLKNSNVLAVGHDSGMVVFKLDRERVAAHPMGNQIFYIKDKWITVYNCVTGVNTSLVACRRPANAMCSGPRAIQINSLNSSEINILAFYKDAEGGAYDFISCPDIASITASPGSMTTYQGLGNEVIFIARNRFALLESSGFISIYNLNNELSKRFEPPNPTDRIFYAGNNRMLLKSDEIIYLYDITARKCLAELSCPGGVRYIFWSENSQYVALVCKHHIVLANNKLEFLCSFYENIRVKSGAWDSLGAFVYTTLSHIKYCLPNGDQGIIRCLSQPIYLLKVEQQKVWVMDRDIQGVRTFSLNCVEYLFKLALHLKQFDQVALLIRNGRLCGNTVVSYLRKKGFPEVALQFVSDRKTRFNLALEDGNLEEATEAAIALDEKSCWDRLGLEAMRQGHFQTAETVYQKTKNFDKLSFFYLISGNCVKLRKMLKIAEMRKDSQARFNNALFLGDVEEQIKVLADVGELPLAALTATVYGLDDISKALEESIEGLDLHSFLNSYGPVHPLKPLTPLIPIDHSQATQRAENWPKLPSVGSRFGTAMEKTEKLSIEAALELQNKLTSGEQIKNHNGPHQDPFAVIDQDINDLSDDIIPEGAWNDLDEIDMGQQGIDSDKYSTYKLHEEDSNQCIQFGSIPQEEWCRKQTRVSYYIAAGKPEEALDYLAKRIGLINAEPLLPVFKTIALSSSVVLPLLPLFPSKHLPLLETGSLTTQNTPIQCVTIVSLFEALREAHRFVTAGKLDSALIAYSKLLHRLTIAEAETQEEEEQLFELLNVSRVYGLAMRIECERQKLSETDVRRSVELAAYLGCCKLQSSHQFLAMRRALTVAWKAQNYITAATFARKLIQGNFSSNIKGVAEAVAQAKKALIASEKKGLDQYPIDFDGSEFDSLVICASSLTRILPAEPSVKCPYCGSVTKIKYKGHLCQVCELSEIGARVLGLQFRPSPSKMPALEFRQTANGIGLVSNCEVAVPGTVLIENELPIVSCQYPLSRALTPNCSFCHKYLGNVADQFQYLIRSGVISELSEVWNEKYFKDLNISEVLNNILNKEEVNVVPLQCEAGCGENYCSHECRQNDYHRGHNFLCVGPLPETHPLTRYKYLCLENSDVFLLCAKLICRLANEALNKIPSPYQQDKLEQTVILVISEFFHTFSSTSFWEETKTPNKPPFICQEKYNIMMNGYELLKEGLLLQNLSLFRPFFLSHEIFSRLLCAFSSKSSLLECTLTDVKIPSQMCNSISDVIAKCFLYAQKNALHKRPSNDAVINDIVHRILYSGVKFFQDFQVIEDQNQTGSTNESVTDVEEDSCSSDESIDEEHDDSNALTYDEFSRVSINELLAPNSTTRISWPEFHGAGFYKSIALMNHSCSPNVQVNFDNGNNTVSLVSLKSITAGEELCQSYIPGIELLPLETRQKKLLDMGFYCKCIRCFKAN